ncbi:MAG: YcaO-like family protein [Brevinematales bacterium]
MGYSVHLSTERDVSAFGKRFDNDFWIRRMEPFFSPLTGIINYYYVSEVGPEEPQLFFSSARLHRMSYNLGIPFDPQVGGIGETAEQAFLSACGEALERYASSVVPVSRLVFASYQDLVARGESAIHPDLFGLFAPFQYEQANFAYEPFREDSPVRWVKGNFLFSGEDVWVPAAFVYMPYMYEYGKETRINHTTSTGLAFHFDPATAWKIGLCEVIERDAFSIVWWTKIVPDEVDLASVGDQKIRRFLDEKFGYLRDKVRVFQLPTDTGFFVFLGLIEEDENRAHMADVPALCMGAAAGLDAETALYKVLLEVVQTWKFAVYLKRQNEMRESKKVFTGNWNEEVLDFTDGVLLYSYPQFKEGVNFLKKGKRISFGEVKKKGGFSSLSEAIASLHEQGFDPVVVDITPEDIRDGGGYVSRVVIPGMVSLNGAHRYRFWGGKRLFSFPKKMGLKDHELTIDELNPYPHPFP